MPKQESPYTYVGNGSVVDKFIFLKNCLSTRSITSVNCYLAVSCTCGKRNEICLFRAQTIGVGADEHRYQGVYHSCLMQASYERAAAQNCSFSSRLLHAQLFDAMPFRAVMLRADRQFFEKCVYPIQGRNILLRGESFISRGESFISRSDNFFSRGDNFKRSKYLRYFEGNSSPAFSTPSISPLGVYQVPVKGSPFLNVPLKT